MGTESRALLPGIGEVGRERPLEGSGLLLGVMRRFRSDTEVLSAQHRECAKCRRRVHFKIVNFMWV